MVVPVWCIHVTLFSNSQLLSFKILLSPHGDNKILVSIASQDTFSHKVQTNDKLIIFEWPKKKKKERKKERKKDCHDARPAQAMF